MSSTAKWSPHVIHPCNDVGKSPHVSSYAYSRTLYPKSSRRSTPAANWATRCSVGSAFSMSFSVVRNISDSSLSWPIVVGSFDLIRENENDRSTPALVGLTGNVRSTWYAARSASCSRGTLRYAAARDTSGCRPQVRRNKRHCLNSLSSFKL